MRNSNYYEHNMYQYSNTHKNILYQCKNTHRTDHKSLQIDTLNTLHVNMNIHIEFTINQY